MPAPALESDLPIDVIQLKKAALILRTVNHKLRQQLLQLLHQNGRMTVTTLYQKLQLEQPVASQHLAILRTAGLVCPGQSLMLQPSIQNGQALSYLWQDGSSNPSYVVQAPGIYTVSVSNHCGISIDSITVRKGVCRLYVPNAFTPNGDGKNDVFRASFGENIIAYELVVYNRWGQKLFESSEVGRGVGWPV